ncbi:MAG: hypothetical protein CMJ36_00835 [Phycisphaerae bacterium]|nr:hypothetical protein [Phycisphaerae bacterium]
MKNPAQSSGIQKAESYLAPETLLQLSSFELRAKMIVEGIRSGLHASPHQGMSVEFNQHRTYTPGDDLRHLDWKVYGRSDRLTVKQYEQETTLDVLLLVDCSASMKFGTLEPKSGWGGTDGSRSSSRWTKFDHATATAAALAWMALQNTDRVGVHLFAEGLQHSLNQRSTEQQWRQVVSLLSRQAIEGGTDFNTSIDQILSLVSNRSLFIILSDFLENPGVLRSVFAKFLHKRHDLLCIQVLDNEEIEFNNQDPTSFLDLESETEIKLDPTLIRDSYRESLRNHEAELRRGLVDHGFDFIQMNSHDPVGPALARSASRRREWLKNRHAG